MDHADHNVTIYRIHPKWWIGLPIIILPIWLFFIIIGWLNWNDGPVQSSEMIYRFLYRTFLFFSLIYYCIWMLKTRYEVSSERIRRIGPFVAHELSFDEIAGYREAHEREVPHYFRLEPKSPGKKKMNIMTADSEALFDLMRGMFPDLDAKESEKELEKVLSNPRFGKTNSERRKTAERIDKWGFTLNILSIFIGLIPMLLMNTFSMPAPYAILPLIMWTVLMRIFYYNFHGILKIKKKPNSFYEKMENMFFSLNWFLFYYILNDFYFFRKELILLPVIVTVLVFLHVIHSWAKVFNQGFYDMVLWLTFTVLVLNCALDTSQPVVIQATIMDKKTSKQYYVDLSTGGFAGETSHVQIEKSVFDQHRTGDSIKLAVYPGKFGIPWFDKKSGPLSLPLNSGIKAISK